MFIDQRRFSCLRLTDKLGLILTTFLQCRGEPVPAKNDSAYILPTLKASEQASTQQLAQAP